MNKQKTTLVILASLILIKFLLLPWNDWVNETESDISRLKVFESKQKQVIENELLIRDELVKYQANFSLFIENLPTVKSGDKANTLWFSLIDTIKKDEIKVYNQRVEFEEYITDDVAYVTGVFYMSGLAKDVMAAVLKLESKSPYVFLEQLKLIRRQGKNKEDLVVQIYLRAWFTTINKNEK